MPSATTKPSYLGLLNAISLAEGRAGVELRAWADVAKADFLKETLTFVAKRETSHSEVFARRIQELGFEVLDRPDPKFEARLAKVSDPAISDVQKLGPEGEETDYFGKIESDLDSGIFDPLTALLLRWYIAEERDSGDRLRECAARVRAEAKG